MNRIGAFQQACLLIIPGVLLVAGCSSEPPPPQKFPVAGKVTYNGQPVTEGIVSLFDNSRGLAYSGEIGSDGNYSVNGGAQSGKYQVVVLPPNPPLVANPEAAPATPPPSKEYPNLPHKYRAAETSGLTLDVKESAATLDIAMQ